MDTYLWIEKKEGGTNGTTHIIKEKDIEDFLKAYPEAKGKIKGPYTDCG